MEWDEKRLCKGPRPGQPQHMAVQTSGRVASDDVLRPVPASNLLLTWSCLDGGNHS